jgi:PII-like signaling protein
MQGVFLKFYVGEYREHKGILLYEWLLERAKKCGFNGGTATRAIAGFGRHGILREESFLELASSARGGELRTERRRSRRIFKAAAG